MQRIAAGFLAVLLAGAILAANVDVLRPSAESSASPFAAVVAPTPAASREIAYQPPVARIVPTVFEEHGRRRMDNYDWLRDEDNPDVIAYLRAENEYAAERLARINPLIDELEHELNERAEGANVSPDFIDGGYVYRRRIAERARFPVIVRHKFEPGAPEQIVLDIESLAAGHEQYSLDEYVVSPDGNLVAFAVDFTGGRLHHIFVRDIMTGKVADTGITDAAPDLVFAADSKSLFYIGAEPETVRSQQLWIHTGAGRKARHQRTLHPIAQSTHRCIQHKGGGKQSACSGSRDFLVVCHSGDNDGHARLCIGNCRTSGNPRGIRSRSTHRPCRLPHH